MFSAWYSLFSVSFRQINDNAIATCCRRPATLKIRTKAGVCADSMPYITVLQVYLSNPDLSARRALFSAAESFHRFQQFPFQTNV